MRMAIYPSSVQETDTLIPARQLSVIELAFRSLMAMAHWAISQFDGSAAQQRDTRPVLLPPCLPWRQSFETSASRCEA